MEPSRALTWIRDAAVVPIVRTPTIASAFAAANALLEGGLDVLEITMTVPGALKAVESLADRFGDRVLLGSGTVLDTETARICILAGSRFLVTPTLNPEVIKLAKRYSVPIFPGGLTPTEVLAAWEAGADAVKVFPCNALGGAKYIKSLKAPLPQIELFPTGGVNLETLPHFIQAGAMAVGAGSELVDNKLLAQGNSAAIAERARQFREAALSALKGRADAA